VPVALMIGDFSSGTQFAVSIVAPFICPKDTSRRVFSFATTSVNDNGTSVPATAYALHCMDCACQTVKEDPIVPEFLRQGIMVAAALILMSLLVFMLAAQAAVLAGRLFRSRRQSGAS